MRTIPDPKRQRLLLHEHEMGKPLYSDLGTLALCEGCNTWFKCINGDWGYGWAKVRWWDVRSNMRIRRFYEEQS